MRRTEPFHGGWGRAPRGAGSRRDGQDLPLYVAVVPCLDTTLLVARHRAFLGAAKTAVTAAIWKGGVLREDMAAAGGVGGVRRLHRPLRCSALRAAGSVTSSSYAVTLKAL